MANQRRMHADRYHRFWAAERHVEDRHRSTARGVADLAESVKTTPRDQILLEIVKCELAGVEAHMAALREHMETAKAAGLEAIRTELPDADVEETFRRLQ